MTKKIANVADYRIALDIYEILHIKQNEQVIEEKINKDLNLVPTGHIEAGDDSNELLHGLLGFILKYQADIEGNAVLYFFTKYWFNIEKLYVVREQAKRINAALTMISRKFIDVNEQQKNTMVNFENQFALAKDILYNYVLDIALPKLSWSDDLVKLMKAHKCSISEISINYDPSKLTFSISAKSTMTRYMENAQEIERLNLRVTELTRERDEARDETKAVIQQRDDARNETQEARNETQLVKAERNAALKQNDEFRRVRDVIAEQRDTAVRQLNTATEERGAAIAKINVLKNQLLEASKLLSASAEKEQELLEIIKNLQAETGMSNSLGMS